MFFFFNDTATTEIYTLSLHDALPICATSKSSRAGLGGRHPSTLETGWKWYSLWEAGAFWILDFGLIILDDGFGRSEEHTSELQSQSNLVCRLLLEKKKKIMLSRCSLT